MKSNCTRGSVFAVVVFHAAFNAAEWFITERLFNDQHGDLNVILVITVLVSVVVIALVFIYGTADLSRHRRQTLILTSTSTPIAREADL